MMSVSIKIDMLSVSIKIDMLSVSIKIVKIVMLSMSIKTDMLSVVAPNRLACLKQHILITNCSVNDCYSLILLRRKLHDKSL